MRSEWSLFKGPRDDHFSSAGMTAYYSVQMALASILSTYFQHRANLFRPLSQPRRLRFERDARDASEVALFPRFAKFLRQFQQRRWIRTLLPVGAVQKLL